MTYTSSAELTAMGEHQGWKVEYVRGGYRFTKDHVCVFHTRRGHGETVVTLRGIDVDFAGLHEVKWSGNIGDALSMEPDQIIDLFFKSFDKKVERAKQSVRSAEEDRQDVWSMFEGWKKRHGF